VLACNVEAGDGGSAEVALEPAPRPVDLVWVSGADPAPAPAVVERLGRMAADDAVDLRVVVLGGDHPFEGPEFADALRDDAAVHVVLGGLLEGEDDVAALDERIAWAVGGPYVLHVIDAGQAPAWTELASATGGTAGVALEEDVVAVLVEGLVDAAPLACAFEVPVEVLDVATHPAQWSIAHASGTLREPVPNVGSASGCVGDGGWFAGEAGRVELCPSSCALGASDPEGRFVVAPATSR